MFLDLQTKASIRRHLGVPFAGRADANTTMGLRTLTKAGQLEFYMNNLQIPEVSILLGRPYGALVLYAPVRVNQTFSFTLGATTVAYAATSQDLAAPDPLASVALGLMAQIQANLPTYIADQATIAVIGNPQLSTAVQIELIAATSTPFSITAPVNVVVLANGNYLPSPTYTVDDGNGNAANAIIAYGLLPICDALESQLINASQNLSLSEVGSRTTGAAVFRPDELRVRNALYARYVYQMGVMLSFYAPNPRSGIPSFGLPLQ